MSVVLCSWGDAIEGGTEETLSLARRVAQATGQELDWLVIGALGEAAASIAPQHGVVHLDRVAEAPSGPDGLVAAIAAYSVTRSIAAGPATPERFAVVSAPKATGPRLEDADIIVSGGRGLGSAANYEMVKEFAGQDRRHARRLACHRR
jgi:hypothetical protein